MKTASIFVITALFLCFFHAGRASGGADFQAEVSDPNTFVLKLQNPGEQKIRVSFLDLDGVTLHEELYSRSQVDRKYNLKNLPEGSYVLVVENDGLIQLQPITKTEDWLIIDADSAQTILPPQIDISARYLNVSMDFPSDTHVYVQMEDHFGQVLYEGDFNSREQLQTRFDLNQLGTGDYSFSVFVEGNVFDHQYTEIINLAGAR